MLFWIFKFLFRNFRKFLQFLIFFNQNFFQFYNVPSIIFQVQRLRRKTYIFVWKNSSGALTIKKNSFISNPKFHFIIFSVLDFRFKVSYSAGKIIFKETFFINFFFRISTKIKKVFISESFAFLIISSIPSNFPNERNSLKIRRILYFLFSGFQILRSSLRILSLFSSAFLINCFANILETGPAFTTITKKAPTLVVGMNLPNKILKKILDKNIQLMYNIFKGMTLP